tara:strand:+ start:4207 stop:4425 length:219 start_codon:yes stop_codon:yes gene_type:complete
MEHINLKDLEENFDSILERAEKGESFHIVTPDGQDVVLVPDSDMLTSAIQQGTVKPYEPDDDFVKLHSQTDI